MNDKTASHKQINNPPTQPTSLPNLQDQVKKHRKPPGYLKNPTYSIPTIVNGLLLTEDNGFVLLRKYKTNDGGNEISPSTVLYSLLSTSPKDASYLLIY